MPDNEQTKAEQSAETKPMDADTARRVEREKMTCRAALRKMGFGAGVAALSLFSVDDLARLVGQRMERMAGDDRVAQAVAKEFQQAGIALAGPVPNGCVRVQGTGGNPGTGECNVDAIGRGCGQFHPDDGVACDNCVKTDCHICACGNAGGVPCNDPACSTYCYSTAISYCSTPAAD